MRRLLLALLVLSAVTTGCRQPAGGGGAASAGGRQDGRTVSLEPAGAPRLGAVQLRVSVRQGGDPVAGAAVEVTGIMTHAGMEPVVSEAVADGPGTYLTNAFAFPMAGDWIITADATYPDGETVSETIALSVPGR